MSKLTSFIQHPQGVCGADGEHLNSEVRTVYDNAEWATGTVTDYDVKGGQAKAFNNVTVARYVSIRTNVAITVKFNATGSDAISVAANTTFEIDTLEVTNIFITAASTANVKIFLT